MLYLVIEHSAHKPLVLTVAPCKSDILEAYGQNVSDIGINELEKLSCFIKDKNLLNKGICEYKGYDIISVPTIIIEKPKTLVGMGDTISAFSLIGAR